MAAKHAEVPPSVGMGMAVVNLSAKAMGKRKAAPETAGPDAKRVRDGPEFLKAVSTVQNVISSQLVSQCPPGDPQVLALFHRLLSLAIDLKQNDISWAWAGEIKSWLKVCT
ncbi:hypothetical protein V5O48_012672 [Marasmius crinis-equi]|uniref:Uncharacterized protein n=1 Tax=Marasmius crinis-equi TaxID=585013 RepID=A0ABR3F255_9AGAR